MNSKKHAVCWIRRIGIVVCSFLCVWSLAQIIALNGDPYVYWGGQYFGYNLVAVALFGLDIFLLKRWLTFQNRRLRGVSIAGGLLMALLIVYGAFAHFKNNIYISTADTFLQFLYVIGIGFLTVPLFTELFLAIEKAASWYQNKQNVNEEQCADKKTFSKRFKIRPWRFFLIVWAGIFVCYVPLFLAWWPGNFIFDAQYQMANVITGDHSTHHPLIHTLLMGKTYELGQSVGDVSWGFQFYTLIQMLILTSSFAYFLLYLYKKKAPKCIQVVCFLWFALFPMHALFSITATKDVLCAAFFLYFLVFLLRYFVDCEKFKWYSYAGMISSGVFLCLFRNNAMYAVILTGIIIAVIIKGLKNKGKVLLLIAAVYLFTTVINEGLITYTNAQESDAYRETLSVPLQSLARVASYRKDDLAPELYDEICVYIREQDIPSYNPYLADPIKNQASEENLENNIINFFKLWIKVGAQFPDEYIESIVTNTMGYWYPINQGTYVSNDIALYHNLIGIGDEIEKRSFCDWAYKIYESLFYYKTFYSVPLLGYSFRNAPYVWTILVFFLWCIYKKDWKAIKVVLLPVAYFLTCLCGPWAALRYIYCLVVSTPLLIHTMISRRRENE